MLIAWHSGQEIKEADAKMESGGAWAGIAPWPRSLRAWKLVCVCATAVLRRNETRNETERSAAQEQGTCERRKTLARLGAKSAAGSCRHLFLSILLLIVCCTPNRLLQFHLKLLFHHLQLLRCRLAFLPHRRPFWTFSSWGAISVCTRAALSFCFLRHIGRVAE